jgi:hypothetical protein
VVGDVDALLKDDRATWASRRKLRLFACACARQLWHAVGDPASQAAVEASERYADGEATDAELDSARDAARNAADCAHRAGPHTDVSVAAWTARAAASVTAKKAAQEAAHHFAVVAWSPPYRCRAGAVERIAEMLDCVLGPRPLPAVERVWFTWNGGTVRKLAEDIYADRAFERLPLLADALEDSGCTDTELLGHLRGPGLHVRGCWAVDLVLGKE